MSSNIISKADYADHNIGKSFIGTKTPLEIITDNFSKGLIDKGTFEKAKQQLDDLLEKASKGEGSRGGVRLSKK